MSLDVQNVLLVMIRAIWTLLGVVGAIASIYVLVDIAKDEVVRKSKRIDGLVNEILTRDRQAETVRLIELIAATLVGVLSFTQPLPPIKISFIGWLTTLLIVMLEGGIVLNTINTARFRSKLKKSIREGGE